MSLDLFGDLLLYAAFLALWLEQRRMMRAVRVLQARTPVEGTPVVQSSGDA